VEKIPRNYNWIVCEDFNMVEDKEDKSSNVWEIDPRQGKIFVGCIEVGLGNP
jgi:hypothetical protein